MSTISIGMRGLLIVLILMLAGTLYPEPWAYVGAIAHGHSLRANTQYRAALDSFRAAHAMRPDALHPVLWEAMTDLDLGRPGDALPLYRQITGSQNPSVDVLTNWGKAYYALGDPERAIQVWQQALHEGSAEAHYYLGQAYYDQSDWSEAASHFEAVLEADVSGAWAQSASYWLGVILTLVDPVRAGTYLGRAAGGPDFDTAEKARIVLQTFKQAAADSRSMATVLGAGLFNLGYAKIAQAHLEEAVRISPDDVETLAYLGEIRSEMGDEKQAETHLRRALQVDPSHPLALFFWGKHQFRRGATPAARETFASLLALDPKNAAACVEIARTYVLEGKYALGEEWFEAAIENAQSQAAFYLVLAEFESDTLFDVSKGLEAIRQVLTMEPDSPQAHDLQGWMLYLSRDWTAAEESLQEALTLDPYQVSAYYHLGKLYESEARPASARWAYGRAIDLGAGHPIQPVAEDALGRLGPGPETPPPDR